MKKIAVMSSTWNERYIVGIIEGIRKKCADNYSVHVFNAYDEAYESMFYVKEKEVFMLPDFSEYEGIIFALNSIDARTMLEEEIKNAISFGKPSVTIEQLIDGIPFCGIDNYKSMYKLVDHMIEMHGARVFNYVGGPEGNYDNEMRYKAFCDCLKIHNIDFDEKRKVNYRFLREDGAAAFEHFKSINCHLADCTVCANDFMAMGYIKAARKAGIRVPNDIKVTGFDNIESGDVFLPSVTSVNRNWSHLGFDACERLLNMIEGKVETGEQFTEGYVKENGSCGCGSRDVEEDYIALSEKGFDQRSLNVKKEYAKQAMTSCASMEECSGAIGVAEDILGIKDFSIVLNDTFFNGVYKNDRYGFTKDVVAYYRNGREERNRKDGILPSIYEEKGGSCYLFSAIHSFEHTYGYCVIPYEASLFDGMFHREFVKENSSAITNLFLRTCLEKH